MHNSLKPWSMVGRTSIITGGCGKLGFVFSKTLASLGSNIICVDLPGSNFVDFRDQISQYDVDVTIFKSDLEDEKARKDLIAEINSGFDTVHCLVNNAAFIGSTNLDGWNTDFEYQQLDTWRRAIEVNLTSIFDLCRGFSSCLRKSGNGTIVNVSSIYGSLGPDWSLYKGLNMSNPAAYSASKGGVDQLTRWLSTTLAPEIRVNAIAPGGILRNQPSEFIERYCKKTPLGRMATEDDFIGVISFLASDASSYVTGQIINIDGGWNAW